MYRFDSTDVYIEQSNMLLTVLHMLCLQRSYF